MKISPFFRLASLVALVLTAPLATPAQIPIEVGRTLIPATKKTVTVEDLKGINSCGRPIFKLKAGMTNQEAASAIDDGMNRYLSCLRRAMAKSEAAK
jgi:hypothetical protein